MMTTKRLFLTICVVAGCGGDKTNHLADAPNNPPDSPPDAPPMGPVTLTVTSQGAPAVGVQVYFQNPDQSLVASPMTNASGDATATIEIGAFVTAIDPAPPPVVAFGVPTQADSLHTWAGVKPGDHLHLDLFPTGTTPTTGNITVIAPTDAQATNYQLHTSCGEDFDITPPAVGSGFVAVANAPVPLTIDLCSANIDLLVETFDVESQPLNSFFKANVAIADGDTVDLTDQTFATVNTVAFDYSNINIAITAVSIAQTLIAGNGVVFNLLGSAPVDGNAANAVLPIPDVTNAIVVTESDILPSDVVSRQRIFDWGPASANFALDVGGAVLHGYATAPAFDPASHAVTWQEVAGVTGDVVLAQYHSFRLDATLSHDWVWTIAAPRAMTPKVGYPVIPTDVFDFNTNATDSSDVRQLTNAKIPGGYDGIRALIMDDALNGQVAGATGHAVIEDVFQGKLRAKPLRRRRH